MLETFLMRFDRAWCGKHQVSASLLSKLADDSPTTFRIASFRFFLSLVLVAELFGLFLITFGLSFQRSMIFFIAGIVLRIGGALLGSFLQNKTGVLLSLEFQKYLNSLGRHFLEVKSFLADRGCSEAEVNSLHGLPSNVYQSELNSFQRMRILNTGAPIACGLALLANGDFVTALIIIILGISSFPIGERFFKENIFRKESELRLGLAAQLSDYINKVYSEHIKLTFKVNSLSQLPLLLFALRFLWNGSGTVLSSFFGLMQGLMGLTGTLAFQKARFAAMRTTETTTHLVNALSSPYLIVTPQRWKEHCIAHKKLLEKLPKTSEDGVMLVDFTPSIPFTKGEIFQVSAHIPAGGIRILRAPSGRGKSTFISSLMHLIEHKGDIFFITNQEIVDTHDLSIESFHEQVFFFREENVDASSRLIDLFRSNFQSKEIAFLQEAKKTYPPLLVNLAEKSPDNLLEHEIKRLEKHQQSAFPLEMLEFLKELRERQITYIQSLLNGAGGNMSSERMFPERIFSTLSMGERRRIGILLALETARSRKVKLVVLDEPLAHLDKTNMVHQVDGIREIQNHSTPPSIILISHHFVEEMKESLQQTEEIQFT